MLVMNSHTMSSMIATDSGSGALASPYPYIISSTAAGHRVTCADSVAEQHPRARVQERAQLGAGRCSQRTHQVGRESYAPSPSNGLLRLLSSSRTKLPAHIAPGQPACPNRARSGWGSSHRAAPRVRSAWQPSPHRPFAFEQEAAPTQVQIYPFRSCYSRCYFSLKLTSNKLLAPATARRA